MKRPERRAALRGKAKADFEYEQRRTRLRQDDLRRFGVETVWIDDYSHLELLLKAVAAHVHRKAVFVAGAAHDPAPVGAQRLVELANALGAALMSNGFNLVSGFGRGLGEHCILGALRALYGVPRGNNADRILARPFPATGIGSQASQNTRHREDLLSRSGAVVVVSGNRLASDGSGAAEISPGVLEEVDIARRFGIPVVPVGITGHAAANVWQAARSDPAAYIPGIAIADELATLGRDTATNEEVVNAVLSLLKKNDAFAVSGASAPKRSQQTKKSGTTRRSAK